MKKMLYTIAALTLLGSGVKAQEFDDIYYNPKTDNTQKTEKKTKKSNYISDFGSIDPDEYNRRGQYYTSAVDTIGARAENDEDFVYTQQIQRFYNPTIVVDNMNMLEEVIDNSYGNVNIVFDNGVPYFTSIYGWPGYYNYYYSGWAPMWATSWAPAWTWTWGPSWSWSWGPAFGYGSWAWDSPWGWGPAWDYGWGWRPAWSHGPGWYAQYAPYGRYPNRPGSQWAANTRPGGNYNGGMAHRPGNSGYKRPGNASTAGVSNSTGGKNYYNYHRTYSGTSSATQNRVTGSASDNRHNSGSSTGTSRYSGRSTTGSGTYNSGSSSSGRSSYNSNRNSSSSSSRSSYSNSSNSSSSGRSSYSTGRSSSSSHSSGTGRTGGSSGGGRGRHR